MVVPTRIMKWNACWTCMALSWLVIAPPHSVAAATAAASNLARPDTLHGFVSRSGDRLMLAGAEFRFLGLDAPNIQQNETQVRADRANRFPDEFEIRDLLGGLAREGSLATRTFSLSVYSPQDHGMPVYLTGRRTYNEAAFQCLDRILALAHEYNVRLIIPFIASQSFASVRGADEFSDLAGKPKGSFWTDESVKDDFKHLLHFIINRTNTVSGVLYRDEPAILCWQLGNEFGSYAGDRGLKYDEWSPRILAWSLEMAAYLKGLDTNHLILEAGGADRKRLLEDPNIDVISDHLYEYWSKLGGGPGELTPMAIHSWEECRGKKPLLIDEFGLASPTNTASLMKTIRQTGIAGGLMWSLRAHRRDGGWYYHNEGGTIVNSYHVPGFSVGYEYDETRLLNLLRQEAFAIRGLPVPPVEIPDPAPVLMRCGNGFTWRGSTGAESYTLERAERPTGPWVTIATTLQDSVIFDVKSFEPSPGSSEPLVLYWDAAQLPGTTYYYRLKGVNIAGATPYSDPIEWKP